LTQKIKRLSQAGRGRGTWAGEGEKTIKKLLRES
jgi:hypothetical protein